MKKSMEKLQNDLNKDIGHLLALKMFNRDYVAEKLGMPRSNLIAALKGRRSLPMKYFSPLVELMGLDSDILLKKDKIHVLSMTKLEKQYHHCYGVLYIFLQEPIMQVAILDIIDDNYSSRAYVFKDKRNAYTIIRDDAKILAYADEHTFPEFPVERDQNIKKLFNHSDYASTKEISLSYFEKIAQNKVSVKDFEHFLAQESPRIWTWDRVRKEAEKKNISPSDVAKVLNFD